MLPFDELWGKPSGIITFGMMAVELALRRLQARWVLPRSSSSTSWVSASLPGYWRGHCGSTTVLVTRRASRDSTDSCQV